MRATSPPTALPVAASVASLLAVVLVPLVVPSAALAERWLRPVPGEVARSFSYARAAPFAAGAHRGVDLAAPPGAVVSAACGGPVVFAGAVTGRARVVTLRCGGRRVTHLPLSVVRVRAGTTVRAGTPLGTLARGHGGLHLGVRRASDPFGYEDPLRLLPGAGRAPPPIAILPRRTARPRRLPAPRAVPAAPRPAPAPRIARRRPAPALRAAPIAPGGRGVAPWTVWVGVALVLCGAAGSGTIAVRRRGRPRPVARAVRTSTPH